MTDNSAVCSSALVAADPLVQVIEVLPPCMVAQQVEGIHMARPESLRVHDIRASFPYPLLQHFLLGLFPFYIVQAAQVAPMHDASSG